MATSLFPVFWNAKNPHTHHGSYSHRCRQAWTVSHTCRVFVRIWIPRKAMRVLPRESCVKILENEKKIVQVLTPIKTSVEVIFFCTNAGSNCVGISFVGKYQLHLLFWGFGPVVLPSPSCQGLGASLENLLLLLFGVKIEISGHAKVNFIHGKAPPPPKQRKFHLVVSSSGLGARQGCLLASRPAFSFTCSRTCSHTWRTPHFGCPFFGQKGTR